MTRPKDPGQGPVLEADPVVPGARIDLGHLDDTRSLCVRRSLLATAVGGLVPLPVLDDYLAGRVRAGMLMAIAERRKVDLPASAAELIADPYEGTALRNATLTAATMLAFKLAWRKFFALLAIGRRAEDMAESFQTGVLFDHYCVRLHVGGALDRASAARLRAVIQHVVGRAHREALVGAFRDGARTLGRSMLEAPRWVGDQVQQLVTRFVQSGGRPDVALDPSFAAASDAAAATVETRWLDRAAESVEWRLRQIGTSYLVDLVVDFERTWRLASAAPPDGTTP